MQQIVHYPVDMHSTVIKCGWNLYRSCHPRHMHQDWILEYKKYYYVYKHIQLAHIQFEMGELHYSPRVVKVPLWADLPSVLASVIWVCSGKMHSWSRASSLSVDSVLCHIGKESSHLFDFHTPSWGVFLLQPSNVYPINSSLRPFSDFGDRTLNPVLSFLYQGAQIPWLGHCGHINGQANVRLL